MVYAGAGVRKPHERLRWCGTCVWYVPCTRLARGSRAPERGGSERIRGKVAAAELYRCPGAFATAGTHAGSILRTSGTPPLSGLSSSPLHRQDCASPPATLRFHPLLPPPLPLLPHPLDLRARLRANHQSPVQIPSLFPSLPLHAGNKRDNRTVFSSGSTAREFDSTP